MDLYVVLACFPVVALGELPDKTMFANLVMATRGHPLQVWLGSAAAFAVHVAIATTVGVALFDLLPRRVIDGVVAGIFLLGAFYAWREGEGREHVEGRGMGTGGRRHGPLLTAFAVIFLAEWGDLTQILITNLAAKYHSGLSVAVGSVLALWAVGGLAVVGGQTLLRFVDARFIRRVTALVLVGLAGYTGWLAVR